jgi:hypothetical protein
MTQVGTTPLARCALAVAALAAALSGCTSDPRHTSEAAAAIAEDAAPIAEAASPAPEAASDPAATPAGQAAAKPATPKVDAHSGDASTASPEHPLAMQVGSTVAFLFERPDAGSAPVAQVREGSAVKVIGTARPVKMEVPAPMHEGFPGNDPPTWAQVTVGAFSGWMPARSLIGPLPLALDSRGLAAERATLVGFELTKAVRDAWDTVPGTPELAEANYAAADRVLVDAARPHDLRTPGRDAFTGGPRVDSLPEARATLSSVSKDVDARAGKVRAAAIALKMPPYDKNAPGNLKEALKVGIGPGAANWKMVNALEYLWFNSRFLTPVEERVIGRECMAMLIGPRETVPQDDPIVHYLTWVLGRIAAQSTTPMPAFGLAVALVRDDTEREAIALPGGPVMLTTGLLRALRNEHQLATLMGRLVADSESLSGIAAAYGAKADRLNAVLQVFELQSAGALEAVVEEYMLEVPEDHTEAAVVEGRDRLLNTASDRYVEIMRATFEGIRTQDPAQRDYAARRGAALVRGAGWTPVNIDAALAGEVSEGAAADASPRGNPGPRWIRLRKELDRLDAPAAPPAPVKPAARPRAGATAPKSNPKSKSSSNSKSDSNPKPSAPAPR